MSLNKCTNSDNLYMNKFSWQPKIFTQVSMLSLSLLLVEYLRGYCMIYVKKSIDQDECISALLNAW